MPEVKRTIKIKTHQNVVDKPSPQEGFPMRDWSVDIFVQNESNGSLVPAHELYDKCLFKLHPSFGVREKQTFRSPTPFKCAEEGWGEFEMMITLTPPGVGKSGETVLHHDLNFGQEDYEATHSVSFKNPKPELLERLKLTGEVPGQGANGVGGRGAGSAKKRKTNNVDMDKLAEGLQQLAEDDLLHVVQMIHEQKSSDTYTKNDVENGEFHVDLYTLPDALVKGLWDYTSTKTGITA
ncbi:MAG: hypothetical protein Q9162_000868 [Coniocarpon cinnabarinum]